VVQAQILANGNGVFTIQASSLKSKGIYELTVSTAGSASGVGNYALDTAFGSATADLSTFAGGSVSASSPQQSFNLYLGESQLFQFLLSAAGSNVPAGSAVQMTIRDKNGNIVYSLTAAAGDTMSSDALLLDPGAYILTFTVLGPPGDPVPTLAYLLLGESISDPIGAVINDPTQVPIYASPTTPGSFLYPNNVPSPIPFMIAPIIA
jgi:hypothetical protein